MYWDREVHNEVNNTYQKTGVVYSNLPENNLVPMALGVLNFFGWVGGCLPGNFPF